MTNLLDSIKKQLEEYAGAASLRLFNAICAQINNEELSANKPQTAVDKTAVVKALSQSEGAAIADEAFRQRLKRFNEALEKISDCPLRRVASTKAGTIVLSWSLETFERQQQKEVLSQSSLGEAIASDQLDPQFLAPRHYQIFVSHAWSRDPAVQKIKDQFVDGLQEALDNLPEQYRDQLTISVFYDRNPGGGSGTGMHGRADFGAQIKTHLSQSAYGLFLLSPGWFTSKACQEEANYFESLSGQKNENAFLLLQESGDRGNNDRRFNNIPVYPEFWCHKSGYTDKQYNNLIRLWQPDQLNDRLNFVYSLRDAICEYLTHAPPPMASDRAAKTAHQHNNALQDKSKLLRRIQPEVSDYEAIKDHMAEGYIIEAEKPKQDSDSNLVKAEKPEQDSDSNLVEAEKPEQDSDSNRTLAMHYLDDWLQGKKATRLLAILGSFGMGKTVTVQRYAAHLNQKRQHDASIPIPVYLDFRRLIAGSEHGRPINVKLSEIIYKALPQAVQDEIRSDQLLPILAREKCLLILDGLDEIGTRIGLDNVLSLYRQMLEIVPPKVWQEADKVNLNTHPVRFIVTCRTHFFRSMREENSSLRAHDRDSRLFSSQQGSLQKVYMAPLTLAQIKALYCKSFGEKEGLEKFSLIKGIHDLPGLAKRPLMARYIGEMAGELVAMQNEGKVINTAAVYDELFAQTLERDGEKCPLMQTYDRHQILKQLAILLCQKQSSFIAVDALDPWFDNFCREHSGLQNLLLSPSPDTRNLLLTELHNISFLVRQQNNFAFAHTSFYEFFLAQALAEAIAKADITAFADRPISDETLAFCHQLAAMQAKEEAFDSQTKALLSKGATLSTRRLAWAILTRRNPAKAPLRLEDADLSHLDLRNFRLQKGTHWHQCLLRESDLTGLDARQATFAACDFTGSYCGNTTFEQCRWLAPRGAVRMPLAARLFEPQITQPANGFNLSPTHPAFVLSKSRALQGHTAPVTACAFSPNGQFILSASRDNTLRTWDTQSGKPILTLKGHTAPVNACAFSPNGQFILSASRDNTLRTWDTQSGKSILTLKGHNGPVYACAFSPNGQFILSASDDHTLRTWDTQSGKSILTLKGHSRPVSACAFSPNGQSILSASDDHTLRTWDTQSGKSILTLKGHSGSVYACAFSPNGQFILSASDDHTLRTWDTQSGKSILTLKGHSRPVTACAFSPNGQFILSASHDKTLRLWDTQSGKSILTLEGHSDWVNACAFSPNGQFILSASDDHTLRTWDTQSGTSILTLKGHSGSVYACAFSPNGQFILSASGDKTLRTWDTQSGKSILTLKGHSDWVTACAFSPNGQFILSVSDDKTLRTWDTQSGKSILTLKGHNGPVYACAFSPNGQFILSASDDHTLRIWDTQSGKSILTLQGHSDSVNACAFSPDGQSILSASLDNTLRIWDTQSGKLILTLKGHSDPVTACAFSPNGQSILSASLDNTLRIWDTQSGKSILTLKGHSDWVNACAFSPDGQSILSASYDNTLRTWDAQSGKSILTLKGHSGPVYACAFSPNGQSILSASDDNTLRLWDAHSGQETMTLVAFAEASVSFDANGNTLASQGALWRYF